MCRYVTLKPAHIVDLGDHVLWQTDQDAFGRAFFSFLSSRGKSCSPRQGSNHGHNWSITLAVTTHTILSRACKTPVSNAFSHLLEYLSDLVALAYAEPKMGCFHDDEHPKAELIIA